MVSIIIPSRNELFLFKTTQDLLSKARGEIEVIVILDGYWPKPKEIIDDPRVHYVHRGKAKGLRDAVSSAVAIAKGKYIMKIDAHCMFDEGFDVKLAESCKPRYVVVPRRYSLDPEKWCRRDKGPIDYIYVECPANNNNSDLCGKVWNYPEGKDKLIDDLMTFQGSCWFMEREYFHELGLFDEKNYGTFRKEPQEISFKCWLSGGRVIRNKKTWYAHLHKGRKYGRGYYASKSDWVKGDEYNKRWLTNSAWDKQTKDFKWMIDKFNPPGWENYEWDKKEKPVKKVKLYQNIGKEEGDFRWQNPKKKHSRFWNEGKWENFIEPLLPNDCRDQTFVEIGCNAGMFLKMAKERGYKNVVGIEKSRSTCEQAEKYRDSLGMDYKIINQAVGENFDFDNLPVADVFLLSTVHYYFDIQTWLKFIDKLKQKTRYCLLVSRSVDKDRHWQPSGEIEDLRHHFKYWHEIGAINDIPAKGDPHPRKLWSIMFESDLKRMQVKDIYIKNERHGSWIEDYKKMNEAKIKLAEQMATDDKIKIEETDYYKRWTKRKEKSWSKEKIHDFVRGKVDLMYDVKHNGLKDPLIVKAHGQICDGGHRLAILRALGYRNVIVRTI